MLSEENHYWLIAFIVIPCESWIIIYHNAFLTIFEFKGYFCLIESLALRSCNVLCPDSGCRHRRPSSIRVTCAFAEGFGLPGGVSDADCITAVSTPRKILERFHLSTEMLQLVIFCSSQWPLTVEGKKRHSSICPVPIKMLRALRCLVFDLLKCDLRTALSKQLIASSAQADLGAGDTGDWSDIEVIWQSDEISWNQMIQMHALGMCWGMGKEEGCPYKLWRNTLGKAD